eukprot:5680317-Pleurochrysis_carterae.AAC.1
MDEHTGRRLSAKHAAQSIGKGSHGRTRPAAVERVALAFKGKQIGTERHMPCKQGASRVKKAQAV